MTGPAHPNRCRQHGLELHPSGVCARCRELDLAAEALWFDQEFMRIVGPLWHEMATKAALLESIHRLRKATGQ